MRDVRLNGKKEYATEMSLESAPMMYLEMPDEEPVTPLKDLLQAIWRRLWVIALTAAVLAAFAAGFSSRQTPVYEGSIKILVGQEQEDGAGGSNLGQDVQGLQQLTLTMAEAVATVPVARAVIDDLNLSMTPEQFLSHLEVQQVTNTQFITVTYKDPDPERAQKIANTVGEEFSIQISEISASANSITATVWERSEVSEAPISPRPIRNGILGLMLGGLLGLGLVFLLEYVADPWRSPTEVEQVSGVPTFGVIRAFEIPKVRSKSEVSSGKGEQ